jgi:ribosomal protein L15
MRIPKLRGFKNRFKVEYEVVNVGDIARLVDAGTIPSGQPAGGSGSGTAPTTVNQDILRAAGLVRSLKKPMKVLGAGELSTPLFVVADAFTKSAREKIEAAGGSVNVLETRSEQTPALGIELDVASPTAPATPHDDVAGTASGTPPADVAETEAGTTDATDDDAASEAVDPAGSGDPA